jgi:GH35 family endo-1,4-beta-xylanase
MVWGAWHYLPDNVKKLKDDPKALEKNIEDRIQNVGETMKGKVLEWDVVNEPVPEHQLTDLLGKQSLITWYKAARQADPYALLFVNDYPSPDSIGYLTSYDETIQYLLDNKAPLGGIGLQGHVGETPWSIPALLQTLDRLGAHGLPVEITEYDTDIKDDQLDAQFLRDFMTAVFSHPSTNGFVMWGFWDGGHWHHKAPLFQKDWTLKPSGKAYEDLVFHDWWTNADGTTDEKGSYQTKGFLGDYEVTVKSSSKSVIVPAKLGKAGVVLPVVLK